MIDLLANKKVPELRFDLKQKYNNTQFTRTPPTFEDWLIEHFALLACELNQLREQMLAIADTPEWFDTPCARSIRSNLKETKAVLKL
jgi:hypothetical protein